MKGNAFACITTNICIGVWRDQENCCSKWSSRLVFWRRPVRNFAGTRRSRLRFFASARYYLKWVTTGSFQIISSFLTFEILLYKGALKLGISGDFSTSFFEPFSTFGRTTSTRSRPVARLFYLHRMTQHRNTRLHIHTSSGIRTHDPPLKLILLYTSTLWKNVEMWTEVVKERVE
jgi:hypothetical protein